MKRTCLLIIALMFALPSKAQEPRGLPNAPEWVKDPENPNRVKPAAQADAPESYGAAAAPVAPAPKAQSTDRFVEAMKPQVRLLRPGGFAAAATSANSGDTLILAPGTYKECASIRASNITIKAERPGTAIFDGVSCDGKAILVLRGNRVVIDGLVFKNATVRDRNGAGIRGEGQGLVVRRSSFLNNENGILYSISTPGTVVIEDSLFDGNGTCEGGGCAHGIYINQVTQLIVRRSTFLNTHIGHHLKSRALSTLVENCMFDEGPRGNSSYQIELPNGGALVARGNLIIKGPRTDNGTAFIAFAMEGIKHPSPPPLIEGNRFINRMGSATYLLVETPGAPKPVFRNNTQSGKIAGAVTVYRG
jgi:hypothetical protein